jgi:tetratricopeptide (TPR) repeat protein
MKEEHIFISHSDKDHTVIDNLSKALELQDLNVWVDNREVRAGDGLDRKIKTAIYKARAFIVVFSPNTFNSKWVLKEVQHALGVRKKREEYVIIPLLLEDVDHDALELYFHEATVGIKISVGPGGISEAMPDILVALRERSPDTIQPMLSKPKELVTELLLELTEPAIIDCDGKQRAQAIAHLKCIPAKQGEREVGSRFLFTAPIGPIEREELRWYLERYYSWPSGVFRERAKKVEDLLPVWGKKLYNALFDEGSRELKDLLRLWKNAEGARRFRSRFTVYVDKKMVAAKDDTQEALANEAATKLLTLPWELLHSGTGFLFQGGSPIPVRRQLPNTKTLNAKVTKPPIRILLVSPRPEDNNAGYIDHRISAIPLVSALESLGDLTELTVLTPPTFKALDDALLKVKQEGTPFHVVHFDGHGVFDKKVGLGGLCFEDSQDIKKLQNRKSDIVTANKIAAVIQNHRIPLVFLDACESAKSEMDPGASVAATLLDQGVASVVAMSHSVLVETARRFVKVFYQQLAQGNTVGEAMLAGRKELHGDAYRINIFGAGKLYLQDWFVPVLYQEKEDLQLLTRVPSRPVQEIDQKALKQRMGALPEEPLHRFVGRSRELLTLERLLHMEKYAVVLGQGGEGKTTLAAELARWLVRTGRFKRAVFVSLEDIYDVRTVVDVIGQQLLINFSVAEHEQLDQALLPIEAKLREEATLLLLDNMETILPPKNESVSHLDTEELNNFFTVCRRLNKVGDTVLLFTSREALPNPFNSPKRTVAISRMDKRDAIDLVHHAMIEAGLEPRENDDGTVQQEVEALVEAFNCHARGLVLLAPEIYKIGVRRTTENLGKIMTDLHIKYPDERERSLYACVQLSLHQLDKKWQNKIKPLGAFQGGGHIKLFENVLQVSEEKRDELARELTNLNLAQDVGYGFLRFHPALCPFLWGQMTLDEQKECKFRWADDMMKMSGFLDDQMSLNTQLALDLTRLELPNLMHLLHHMKPLNDSKVTVRLATRLEQLTSYLGRKDLLTSVMGIREEETKKLDEWSNVLFESVRVRIERLLSNGNLPEAYQEAQALLERCLQEGEGAYLGACYDVGVAYFMLGRTQRKRKEFIKALQCIHNAIKIFKPLAQRGNRGSIRMISTSEYEIGDCLFDQDRFDEAAVFYEAGIKESESYKNQRGGAVGKGQLATVRMQQKRYDEALRVFFDSIKIFEKLWEPGGMAVGWHKVGMVYDNLGETDEAEHAYRKSLAIKVKLNDPVGEITTLNQLGNLYGRIGRLEEATKFLKQAVNKCAEIKDRIKEGTARNNLAEKLIKLKRYDEARSELQQTFKLLQSYEYLTEFWKTWNNRYDLEQADGKKVRALFYRQQAIQSYLTHRRKGGKSDELGGKLCSKLLESFKLNKKEEFTIFLENQLKNSKAKPENKLLISKLITILSGSRDPNLAQDPELYYIYAAELTLLLEEMIKRKIRP